MMNIINLFKNNLNRIITQKAVVIIAFVVIPIMIGVGVLFTEKVDIKGNIALVTDNEVNLPKDNRIQIDVMNKKPAISNLLVGKYIATVEEKNNGAYEVTTLKNDSDKRIIENFFKTGKILENNRNEQAEKGVGTNILGFILMILLMQGIALITLYTEDRDIRTFRRVLTAPVSEKTYLFVQGVFTFLCLFIPSYLALVITKVIFNVNIGFSHGMLAMLIAILSALSTSLALFISSALERNYSLTSSGIYVITCVLAGCFYSFTGNNKILDAVCNILPQKTYMALAQGIEKGSSILEYSGQLIYLLTWIIVLWILGSAIIKRKVKRGVY